MKKVIAFSIFLFLIVSNIHGQNIKQKKETFANEILYEYQIEKKSKTRSGNFQFFQADNIIVNGQFKNDKKNGEWQFYDKNELILTVFYENDSVINSKETENTSLYTEEFMEKVIKLVRIQTIKNLKYPISAAEKGQTGTAELRLTFNELGMLINKEIAVSSGFKLLDKAALEIFDNFHGLPGIENKKPIKYVINYPIVFRLG